MKIIFSPSKGMKYREIENLVEEREPLFPEKTENLIRILKSFSKEELGKIMKLKGELLDRTFENYANYETLSSHRGIELYSGVSFGNLNPESYDKESLEYMENHLKILSALYGMVTPTTLIKEYRLDMTMKIGDFSLYNYWKDSKTPFQDRETIVNLASGEFSKMLDRKRYGFIDIEFRQKIELDLEGSEFKNISTEAKKMRGKLLDFMIKNRVTKIEDILNFEEMGYRYSKELSEEKKLFFVKISC